MPTTVKFKIPSDVDGARNRSVTDVTLDYDDAASLPDLVRFQGRMWERTGGANSTNYKPHIAPTLVDLDRRDADKIIEA